MASFEENQWQDITRIPQDDGPHPVVKINYAQECMNLAVLLCLLFYRQAH